MYMKTSIHNTHMMSLHICCFMYVRTHKHTFKGIETRILRGHLHSHVYCSTSFSHKELASMFMDIYVYVHTYIHVWREGVERLISSEVLANIEGSTQHPNNIKIAIIRYNQASAKLGVQKKTSPIPWMLTLIVIWHPGGALPQHSHSKP